MKRQPSFVRARHAPKSGPGNLTLLGSGLLPNKQAPITRGLMPKVGVEPTCPQGALRPERSASASSATSAPCHSTSR